MRPQGRPACLVCMRISGKELPGFCLKCWRDRVTDAEKLAVLSPLHHAAAWRRIPTDDEPLIKNIRGEPLMEPPPYVPGEPVPIWSTGWQLWSYDFAGRQQPLEHVLKGIEHRHALAAAVQAAKDRWVAGVDVRSDAVVYGAQARGDEQDDETADAGA